MFNPLLANQNADVRSILNENLRRLQQLLNQKQALSPIPAVSFSRDDIEFLRKMVKVYSVNGKIGDVVLNATGVGAYPDTGGILNGNIDVRGGAVIATSCGSVTSEYVYADMGGTWSDGWGSIGAGITNGTTSRFTHLRASLSEHFIQLSDSGSLKKLTLRMPSVDDTIAYLSDISSPTGVVLLNPTVAQTISIPNGGNPLILQTDGIGADAAFQIKGASGNGLTVTMTANAPSLMLQDYPFTHSTQIQPGVIKVDGINVALVSDITNALTGYAQLAGANFVSLSVGGVSVSVTGHSHNLSDIGNMSALMRTANSSATAAAFINGMGGASGMWATGQIPDLSGIYAAKAGSTFTGAITTATATTTIQSLIIPHGVAPTSPTNGSIWTTSTAATGIQARINGATVTVCDLSSAQTLVSKTLTTPTINGAAFSGTVSGNYTNSGIVTFSTAPVISAATGSTNGNLYYLANIGIATYVACARLSPSVVYRSVTATSVSASTTETQILGASSFGLSVTTSAITLPASFVQGGSTLCIKLHLNVTTIGCGTITFLAKLAGTQSAKAVSPSWAGVGYGEVVLRITSNANPASTTLYGGGQLVDNNTWIIYPITGTWNTSTALALTVTGQASAAGGAWNATVQSIWLEG